MCRTTVIFETLKDGSLEINRLALNNGFSYRNVFQNGVNALSKMVIKKPRFLSKSSKFCVILTLSWAKNAKVQYDIFLTFYIQLIYIFHYSTEEHLKLSCPPLKTHFCFMYSFFKYTNGLWHKCFKDKLKKVSPVLTLTPSIWTQNFSSSTCLFP